MSAQGSQPLDWEGFAGVVASVVGTERGPVRRETRLIGDLGMDSLDLTELIAALAEETGSPALADGLEQKDWLTATAGDLLDMANRPRVG